MDADQIASILEERAIKEIEELPEGRYKEVIDGFLKSPYFLGIYPNEEVMLNDLVAWFALEYVRSSTTILDEILSSLGIDRREVKVLHGPFSIRDAVKVNDRYYVKLFHRDAGEVMVEVDPELWKDLKGSKSRIALQTTVLVVGNSATTMGNLLKEPLMTDLGFLTSGFLDKAMEMIDRVRLEDLEGVQVSSRMTVRQVLNKLPATWVEEASRLLKVNGRVKKERIEALERLYLNETERVVNGLPAEAREALRFILEKGGMVRYGDLTRKFADDTTYFYHEPRTPVGLLRLYGLVFVGKARKGERSYRVAIIPADLREKLERVLK
ncbi:hypothetical protein L3N51_01501 [Metallosphaera sp. J1]|uniref:hypothetical protein n=1 Tax=Metallosphaera javensis (ex Hofmann et al. 2022) TaxID=99938 RepID=UPI001EE0DE4F|nr:hypothetical protein [Metallosphaera javensis (ex Hofmann et al. 2022)]MCG3109211.1 hypothetical protein [Metallosphaera javensis (ex Hofmann et al. 2022)]